MMPLHRWQDTNVARGRMLGTDYYVRRALGNETSIALIREECDACHTDSYRYIQRILFVLWVQLY